MPGQGRPHICLPLSLSVYTRHIHGVYTKPDLKPVWISATDAQMATEDDMIVNDL